jgi:hypothetical protein
LVSESDKQYDSFAGILDHHNTSATRKSEKTPMPGTGFELEDRACLNYAAIGVGPALEALQAW